MTLFELNYHPYVKIESKGKKLVVTFQDNYSSHSKWYEVIVKFDPQENNYTLLKGGR